MRKKKIVSGWMSESEVSEVETQGTYWISWY